MKDSKTKDEESTRLPCTVLSRSCCHAYLETSVSQLAEIRKREKAKAFSFCNKKSLPKKSLLLYPISILSSKVKHNGSIYKYTQLVMLTHYSPLRG